MYFKTFVEIKIVKDYSLVRKYNILIIINEKDYLIRLVDEKNCCITLRLTNCLIFFMKNILP